MSLIAPSNSALGCGRDTRDMKNEGGERSAGEVIALDCENAGNIGPTIETSRRYNFTMGYLFQPTGAHRAKHDLA